MPFIKGITAYNLFVAANVPFTALEALTDGSVGAAEPGLYFTTVPFRDVLTVEYAKSSTP